MIRRTVAYITVFNQKRAREVATMHLDRYEKRKEKAAMNSDICIGLSTCEKELIYILGFFFLPEYYSQRELLGLVAKLRL